MGAKGSKAWTFRLRATYTETLPALQARVNKGIQMALAEAGALGVSAWPSATDDAGARYGQGGSSESGAAGVRTASRSQPACAAHSAGAAPARDMAAPANPEEGPGGQRPVSGAGAAAGPGSARETQASVLSGALSRILAAWSWGVAPDSHIVAGESAGGAQAPLGSAAGSVGGLEARGGTEAQGGPASAGAGRRAWEAAWQRVAVRAGAPGARGPPIIAACASGAGCCDMRAGDRSRRKRRREVRSASVLPSSGGKHAKPKPAKAPKPSPSIIPKIAEERESAAAVLGDGWRLVETRRGGGGWEFVAYCGPGGEAFPTLCAAQERAHAAAVAADAAAGCQTLAELMAWVHQAAREGAPPKAPGMDANLAALLLARAMLRNGRVSLRRARAPQL